MMTIDVQEQAGVQAARSRRLRAELRRDGLSAALLFDPENIRFATGYSVGFEVNLQHTERWALVPVDGEPIIWEHPDVLGSRDQCEAYASLLRPASGWDLLGPGPREPARFAALVTDALQERAFTPGAIGLDGAEASALIALSEAGLELRDAAPAVQRARIHKGSEEIDALRTTGRICVSALEIAHREVEPGQSTTDVWVALEQAALRLGAEDCVPELDGVRMLRAGDLVTVDARIRGAEGLLVHVSRAYSCGVEPGDEIREVRRRLDDVLVRCRPGSEFADLSVRGVAAHGCGLGEEFPDVTDSSAPPGRIQEGVVLSIGIRCDIAGSDICVRDQVIVTSDGCESLVPPCG